jgi:NosR/NirI family transcriptional regulator, nitrous oxide reductase regulator
MSSLSTYFNWLQKDCPTGLVEKYPELDGKSQTSLKGCYVVGDLTGIPLLKMAADGGSHKVRQLSYEKDFIDSVGKNKDIYDIVIVGGGPAGVSAAIECQKRKLNYVLLEGSKLFNTIENFPKGKPILAKPDDYETTSELQLKDGIKESLLEDLNNSLEKHDLNIELGIRVESISKKSDHLLVNSKGKEFKALRVILAIGKSGDSRKLNVPGEEHEKVYNRLFDPAEFKEKKILVVGGGDSALETAIALVREGNQVTISYRKKEFSRPKQENMNEVKKWKEEGKLKLLYSSTVKEIKGKNVILNTEEGEQEIDNDNVFVLIGRELPLQFFKRCGIKIEGEKSSSWYIFLTTMVSFFTMLYFGKSGFAITEMGDASGILAKVTTFFTAPFTIDSSSYGWLSKFSFYMGWIGAIIFFISSPLAIKCMLKDREKYFKPGWPLIKYTYIIMSALLFTAVYLKTHYMSHESQGWVEGTTYWYSLLYCTTMLLFGVRRYYVKRTRYIKWQMITLVSIQVFFLFLLPFHLYPFLENFFGADSLFIKEVFPNGKWSSFALILLWPLNMWEFGSSTFWTIFPVIQTFVILPLIIKYWGKGVYCGWICSCGGMAETLGDEYRTKAPHGPKAKKNENIGQYILAFAFIATAIVFFTKGTALGAFSKDVYKLTVDIFFAGVLGLGVYFFMGGRVWCRFGCPLAALMHIYTRFSRYRIVAEKKKCISCNICTKVCHMGIDVMNFANKGKPMNDVECVRCSTCITSCPMDVLSFATLDKGDPDNKQKIETPLFGKDHWKAGIK